MAENSVRETDINALKAALLAQQQLLQNLYNELEKEREASATAASEALSMILRLQGEKAAVKMEASQYKRMAEEKISHAEESLAFFEDLIYQKEMEIASLEFQIQAYRCKKVSMGSRGTMRRNSSLPQTLLDSDRENGILQRKKSQVLIEDLNVPSIVEENPVSGLDNLGKKNESSAIGDFDSYWEQIKRLDERVKEISDCNEFSKIETSSESLIEIEATTACSSSVLDIFEVPENHQNQEKATVNFERDKIVMKAETVLQETDRLSKPKDGFIIDYNLALVQSNRGRQEYKDEIEQLKRRIEQLEEEREREIIRQVDIDGREEELKLLMEIREQLNLLQSEVRNQRIKNKSRRQEDATMVSLMEAMLHFWL